MGKQVEISDLIGKTLLEVSGLEVESEEITLTASDGSAYRFYHYQDCCESVQINDVEGDVSDLIGSPIVVAEEVNSADYPAPPGEYIGSHTWTFYRIATAKGFVVIRWLGESNGYYSESVDFEMTQAPTA